MLRKPFVEVGRTLRALADIVREIVVMICQLYIYLYALIICLCTGVFIVVGVLIYLYKVYLFYAYFFPLPVPARFNLPVIGDLTVGRGDGLHDLGYIVETVMLVTLATLVINSSMCCSIWLFLKLERWWRARSEEVQNDEHHELRNALRTSATRIAVVLVIMPLLWWTWVWMLGSSQSLHYFISATLATYSLLRAATFLACFVRGNGGVIAFTWIFERLLVIILIATPLLWGYFKYIAVPLVWGRFYTEGPEHALSIAMTVILSVIGGTIFCSGVGALILRVLADTVEATRISHRLLLIVGYGTLTMVGLATPRILVVISFSLDTWGKEAVLVTLGVWSFLSLVSSMLAVCCSTRVEADVLIMWPLILFFMPFMIIANVSANLYVRYYETGAESAVGVTILAVLVAIGTTLCCAMMVTLTSTVRACCQRSAMGRAAQNWRSFGYLIILAAALAMILPFAVYGIFYGDLLFVLRVLGSAIGFSFFLGVGKLFFSTATGFCCAQSPEGNAHNIGAISGTTIGQPLEQAEHADEHGEKGGPPLGVPVRGPQQSKEKSDVCLARNYVADHPEWTLYGAQEFPREELNPEHDLECWCRSKLDCSDLCLTRQPSSEAPKQYYLLFVGSASKERFHERRKEPLRSLHSSFPARPKARINFIKPIETRASIAADDLESPPPSTFLASEMANEPAPAGDQAPSSLAAAPSDFEPEADQAHDHSPLLRRSRVRFIGQGWMTVVRNTFIEIARPSPPIRSRSV